MKIFNLTRYINRLNRAKPIFTPGPGPITSENLIGLGPAFGRGDSKFDNQKSLVEDWLKYETGKQKILTFQGSGSLACEIAIRSFVHGRILVINSGYYSDRLIGMVRANSKLNSIEYVKLEKLDELIGTFDWIVSCYVETSVAFKINLITLKQFAKKFNSKLLIDATASVGLEENHNLADVLCFSSCKGLFGLTGAGFIAFDDLPKFSHETSFYLDFNTHYHSMVTGPYHAIQSLVNIIPFHNQMKNAVKLNKELFTKKFINNLVYEKNNQPLIATMVNCRITSSDPKALLYLPRKPTSGSIISHLGEAHLKNKAKGKLIDILESAD